MLILEQINKGALKMSKTSMNCSNCGNEMLGYASKRKISHNRFCSKDCRKSYRNNHDIIKKRFMKYVEIVSDDVWTWVGAKNSNGYGHLCINGKLVLAHRLSYKLFIGDIPGGLCVCHKFDDPDNVCPDSLWLGTRAQNNADRTIKGRCGKSKLNNKIVLAIRELYYTGSYSLRIIAKGFNVSSICIYNIVSRSTWKHI